MLEYWKNGIMGYVSWDSEVIVETILTKKLITIRNFIKIKNQTSNIAPFHHSMCMA
jgi:hypothetical protein